MLLHFLGLGRRGDTTLAKRCLAAASSVLTQNHSGFLYTVEGTSLSQGRLALAAALGHLGEH